MSIRESLPWNWGRKDVPVKRESGSGVAPARNIFDLLDEFRLRPFGGVDWPSMSGFGFGEEGRFLPALDAKETDDEVRITVELPGLEEKDVEVALRDDVLTIKGEKQDESKHEEGDSQWVERRFGSFRREIPLPADVDVDKVKASFKSGVLTVVAPRTGEPQDTHKSIPIQTHE